MTDTYRGFAPRSSRDSISATLAAAVAQVQADNPNGTIVVTVHPASADGITPPLGVTLKTDSGVPPGLAWISVPEPATDPNDLVHDDDDQARCPECGAIIPDAAMQKRAGPSVPGASSDCDLTVWRCECGAGGAS